MPYDSTRRAGSPAEHSPTTTDAVQPKRRVDLAGHDYATQVQMLAPGGGGGAEAPQQAPQEDIYYELEIVAASDFFDEGAAHYDAGEYQKAHDSFMAGYASIPSSEFLFSAAQSLRKGGIDDQAACALYRRYLAEGGLREADAREALYELDPYYQVEVDSAAEAFDEGAAHYDAGEYQEAHDAFMRAYESFSSPELLFSAAQALRKGGIDDRAACALYRRYLAEDGVKRAADAREALYELDPYYKVEVDSAAEAFDEGAAHYDAGEYQEAHDAFMRAYQDFSSPELLFSAAQALRTGDLDDAAAVALYQRYLDEGGTKRAAEAERYIQELSPKSPGPGQ